MPVDKFLHEYCGSGAGEHLECRIRGTAVVMASMTEGVPGLLVHHVERLRVLHETLILLTVRTARVPYTRPRTRAVVTKLGEGFYRVVGTYGFMDHPDVPALLLEAKRAGLTVDVESKELTYFLGRETILALPSGQMGEIEESMFAALSRNSRPATAHFNLPPGQVIEIGTQIDL